MISRITTISPTAPLGAYPQDRLCGQIGIIPKSARIKITSNIVLNDIIDPPVKMIGIYGALIIVPFATNAVHRETATKATCNILKYPDK